MTAPHGNFGRNGATLHSHLRERSDCIHARPRIVTPGMPSQRHRGPPRWAVIVACVIAAMAFVAAVAASGGCSGDANRRVQLAAVVGGGAHVTALAMINRSNYRTAVEPLHAQGIPLAEYVAATHDLDVEYLERASAIRVINLAIDAAALCLDGNCTAALNTALEAVDRSLVILARGGLMPAIAIPPEVVTALAVMRTLAPRVAR